MRHMTDQGLALIKRFEGFSATPYLCPAGWWTIGWGAIHGLDGQPVTAATPPVTEEEAETLLRRDVAVAERAVLRLVNIPLADGRFDALASFAFNLGGGALQRSTLRRKVNREEHDDAPDEFRKWVWGGGRKLPGLIRRREAEARIYAGAG
ncbi:MAG: muraminidase [Rhodospirillales bacterium RIFCSPLOWO2_12_FULL_58_28]|nr:MAG: muraminidase [Rhodospirillales bacterium RIFCSPLOWO2_02_FULL_58_16]OHC78202.1 MAG: muraminidase [Rhodospirillales bacterium RIFCSPLOWO2_12_FULL_58_28]